MMMDKNGREIRTGDVVRVTNAYFKTDNALYYVKYSPGDCSWSGDDYCLNKIHKDGTISTTKYNTAFWPLVITCNDRTKRAIAWDWNREHAEIEVIDTVDRTAIRDHFKNEAANIASRLERMRWDYGKHSVMYINDDKIRRHYLRVAASI